jgi:Flp pilus assembly protein TadG
MRILRSTKRRRGTSLVEFALCAVVFLAMLFGIMDWAWVLYKYQTLVWHTSDAARYAAAHSTADTATINKIVMCGTPTCAGGGMGFYTAANISVDNGLLNPVAASDQVDQSGLGIPAETRYFVKVTVSGYQITHFIPWIGSAFTGQPIVAVQPMECVDAAGNCTYTSS